MPDGSYKEVDAHDPLTALVLKQVINGSVPKKEKKEGGKNVGQNRVGPDVKTDEKPPESYIKTLVAPTGDGKTVSVMRALGIYINAVGFDLFCQLPPWLFVSSVKSSLPFDWNVALSGENGELSVDVSKTDIYKALVEGSVGGFEPITKEEFFRIFFVYKGVRENLIENFTEKNVEAFIASRFLNSDDYYEKQILIYIKYMPSRLADLSQLDPYSKEFAWNELFKYDRKIRNYFKWMLERDVKKYNKGHSVNERMTAYEYYKANSRYGIISILYPEVDLPEKKLVLATVHKAFLACTPITQKSNNMYRLPCMKGGHVIIDESDQSYSTVLNICLQNNIQPYDYFAMLHSLYNLVSTKSCLEQIISGTFCPKERFGKWSELKKRYEGAFNEQTGIFSDGIVQRVCQMYDKIHAGKLFYAMEDDKGFFLFTSSSSVTLITRSDKRFFMYNHVDGQNLLCYQETNLESSGVYDFLKIADDVRNVIASFFRFIGAVVFDAHEYRKDKHASSFEEDFKVLLAELFQLDYEQFVRERGYNVLERLAIIHSGLAGHEGFIGYDVVTRNQTCVAARGLQDFHLKFDTDIRHKVGDQEYYRVQLIYSSCRQTPETMLLAMGRNMNVVLMSAGADNDCLIRNYNLEYIDKFTPHSVFMSESEYDEIAAYHEKLQSGNEKIDVVCSGKEVQLGYSLDYYCHCGTSFELWSELLEVQGNSSSVGNPLGYSSHESLADFLKERRIAFCMGADEKDKGLDQNDPLVFLSMRMFRVIQFVHRYIKLFNENKVSHALYYMNVVFSGRKDAPCDIATLYALVDRLLLVSPIREFKSIKSADFVLVADASSVLERKKKCQELLYEGKPCIIITSYSSASVAQNFQAYVDCQKYADQLEKVGVWEQKFKECCDRKYVECAVPLIGMEKVTNIIYNFKGVNNPVAGESTSAAVDTAVYNGALFQVLSILDSKEISHNVAKILVRSIFEYQLHELSRIWDISLLELDQMDRECLELKKSQDPYFDIENGCHSLLYKTRTARVAASLVETQVIGRMNRAATKFKTEYIMYEYDLVFSLCWGDRRLQTHEARVLDAVLNIPSAVVTSYERNLPEAKMLLVEKNSMTVIKGMASRCRNGLEARNAYKQYKLDIVRHIFSDREDVRRWYLSGLCNFTSAHETAYYVQFADGESDLKVARIGFTPLPDVRMVEVGIDTINVKPMLKYPGFEDYLHELGISTDWNGGDYMLSVYALISVVQGYLGELFVKFVLAQNGIRLGELDEIGDDGVFELFDFFVERDRKQGELMGPSDILVDVKNWVVALRSERTVEDMLPDIARKAKECNVHRLIFVNCFSEFQMHISESVYSCRVGDEDYPLTILSVPGLVDFEGHEYRESVESIRKYIQEIYEQE